MVAQPPIPVALEPVAARVEQVARTYWRGNPPCGPPVVRVLLEPADVGAEADFGACRITFNAYYVDRGGGGFWASPWTCAAMVHEWGHLTLGPTYFAASNPGDPSHSPDPRSIMTGGALPDPFAPCDSAPRRNTGRRRP